MSSSEGAAGWDESPPWLGPWVGDEDREFWEGARRGELRIQRCRSCGLHQHYARYLCVHCSADEPEWVTASGNGTVYSYTVIRQNGIPPFKDRVPFVVAAVDLDEAGARVLAPMPGVDPGSVHIGMRVHAVFRPAGDEYGWVDFAP